MTTTRTESPNSLLGRWHKDDESKTLDRVFPRRVTCWPILSQMDFPRPRLVLGMKKGPFMDGRRRWLAAERWPKDVRRCCELLMICLPLRRKGLCLVFFVCFSMFFPGFWGRDLLLKLWIKTSRGLQWVFNGSMVVFTGFHWFS